MSNKDCKINQSISISELVKNIKNRINESKNTNEYGILVGCEDYNNNTPNKNNKNNKNNIEENIENSDNNIDNNDKNDINCKINKDIANNINDCINWNNNGIGDNYSYYNYDINVDSEDLDNIELNNPKLYINRELSWLEFNRRVLEESEDNTNPLLERMKFLAIFNSNLDEFFMIRVAGLKQRVSANIVEPSPDGLTPQEQLIKIHEKTKTLIKNVEMQYRIILNQLKEHGIYIHDLKDVDDSLRNKANKYFKKYIMPILTPLGLDATHPFPHIVNLGFNILIKINSEDGAKLGLVPIPKNIPRFIEIHRTADERHFVLLEDIILENIDKLFPNQKIKRMITFRLTRDADIRIQEDEADDLLEEIEKGLKERRFGKAVRLEINGNAHHNKYLVEFLKDEYDLEDMDIYNMDIPLNLTDLWYLYENIDDSNLKYKPNTPYLSSIFDIDLFSTLRFRDLVLFLPYDSFEPVIDFLNSAADDPNVLAIKMVLYRTGKNSPIIDALKRAVRNGKEVTVIIELKARFDEESNISWAKYLEEEGVHVVYGIPKLKIHAKMIMIVKKENNGIKRYLHLGTGNYNHSTAKIYSDLGIMSSNDELGKDVEKIFNAITGYFQHPHLSKIYISPHKLKKRLIHCIRNEAKHGSNGRIIAKMNSLVDIDIIKELYKASQNGVKIDLIVRGICCLRPGIKGISDNIHVRSIVGKYLEHARVFYFKNGNSEINNNECENNKNNNMLKINDDNKDSELLYISSADWMPRNFNKRVETMVPVESKIIRNYIKDILNIQLKDTAKSRILQPDGSYIRPKNRDFNSQEYFEKWVKLVDINNL